MRKQCTCGKITFVDFPTNAKTNTMGLWWECPLCHSTLFMPWRKVNEYRSRHQSSNEIRGDIGNPMVFTASGKLLKPLILFSLMIGLLCFFEVYSGLWQALPDWSIFPEIKI